jgi:hypothetical protein
MDNLFASTILLDAASITVPSSPFRATMASIGSVQSDPETKDDEMPDDSDDEDDDHGTDPPVFAVASDSEDEMGQDPPPIFTPHRARKAALRVAIPEKDVSMRIVWYSEEFPKKSKKWSFLRLDLTIPHRSSTLATAVVASTDRPQLSSVTQNFQKIFKSFFCGSSGKRLISAFGFDSLFS